MKIYFSIFLFLSCVSFSSYGANGDYGPVKGDREFTLSGSGTSNNDFDRGTLGLSASYGSYLTDNWLMSIRQGLNFADLANDNIWNGSTRLVFDYHWNLGKWRPLVGLQAGAIYGDGVQDTGVAGPEVGVKYYAKPDTFIYFIEEYRFFFEDTEDVNDNFDDGAFVHNIGVGFNF